MAGKKCTRSEIIDSVAKKTETPPQDVRIVLDSLLDVIKAALADNKIIELRGFGTFEVKGRKGREKARNPKTGDLVSVDPHGVAIFRAGKELKQSVWNLTGDPDGPDSEEDGLFIESE